MLPDFPEVKAQAGRILDHRIRNQISNISPILGEITRTRQHEGRDWSIGRGEARRVGGYERTTAGMELTRDQLRSDFKAVLEQYDRMAEEFAEQQSKALFTTISEAAEGVGNVVSADGELDQDTLLEAMKMIQVEMDPVTREPKNAFLVMHPDVAEKLIAKAEEWEEEPAFRRKLKEMREKQWMDWRDRESRRRLVD